MFWLFCFTEKYVCCKFSWKTVTQIVDSLSRHKQMYQYTTRDKLQPLTVPERQTKTSPLPSCGWLQYSPLTPPPCWQMGHEHISSSSIPQLHCPIHPTDGTSWQLVFRRCWLLCRTVVRGWWCVGHLYLSQWFLLSYFLRLFSWKPAEWTHLPPENNSPEMCWLKIWMFIILCLHFRFCKWCLVCACTALMSFSSCKKRRAGSSCRGLKQWGDAFIGGTFSGTGL